MTFIQFIHSFTIWPAKGIENHIIKPVSYIHKSNIYGLKPVRKVTSLGTWSLLRSCSVTILDHLKMRYTCTESYYTLERRMRMLQDLQLCSSSRQTLPHPALLTPLQTFLKEKPTYSLWHHFHPPVLVQCDNLWWSISIFFCLPNVKKSLKLLDPVLRLPAPNLVFLLILTSMKQVQIDTLLRWLNATLPVYCSVWVVLG